MLPFYFGKTEPRYIGEKIGACTINWGRSSTRQPFVRCRAAAQVVYRTIWPNAQQGMSTLAVFGTARPARCRSGVPRRAPFRGPGANPVLAGLVANRKFW